MQYKSRELNDISIIDKFIYRKLATKILQRSLREISKLETKTRESIICSQLREYDNIMNLRSYEYHILYKNYVIIHYHPYDMFFNDLIDIKIDNNVHTRKVRFGNITYHNYDIEEEAIINRRNHWKNISKYSHIIKIFVNTLQNCYGSKSCCQYGGWVYHIDKYHNYDNMLYCYYDTKLEIEKEENFIRDYLFKEFIITYPCSGLLLLL